MVHAYILPLFMLSPTASPDPSFYCESRVKEPKQRVWRAGSGIHIGITYLDELHLLYKISNCYFFFEDWSLYIPQWVTDRQYSLRKWY